MTAILELLSAVCLLLGGVLCITGGVGLLQMEWSLDSVKVVMILILVLTTNPTATHALTKATLHGGQRPLELGKDQDTTGEGSSTP